MEITDNYNKGTKYLEKKNYEKALQFLKREKADFKEKFLNLGNAYRGLNNDSLAGENYARAADESLPSFNGQRGKYPLALNNLGLLCYRNGDDLAASTLYESALVVDPVNVDTLWNYSISMLRMGCSGEDIDWERAWTMYEYRFQKGTKLDRSVPRWFGGLAPVVTVLAEQGFGDKFQFWRYLWRVRAECGGDVLVQCDPSLWDFVRMIGFEPTAVARGLGIPVCSLAWKYGFSERSDYVGGRESTGSGIGVVWSGSKTHANDKLRSCFPGYFKQFRDFDNVVGLNPGHSFSDIKCGVNGTWLDTVSVLRSLRLVVTVDTSIVHLAGVVGTPCIMLQPLKETDYRWGVGRVKVANGMAAEDNIWYPGVTVVENNDWAKTFERVRGMVEEFYAG